MQVRGFVVRQNCDRADRHVRQGRTLDSFLKENGSLDQPSSTPGRSSSRSGRRGRCAAPSSSTRTRMEVLKKLRNMPYPSDEQPGGRGQHQGGHSSRLKKGRQEGRPVRLRRQGNIIRELSKRFNVYQLPYDTPMKFFRDHRGRRCHDLQRTGRPGPSGHCRSTTIRTIREIKDDYPIMGICMGNQLLAMAFGGHTPTR